MSIFFLKRLKKRNNYDDLKTLPTTWNVTWAYDNYYNNGNFTHCSSCGKLIRIKSKIGRPIEYCDECVKKMNYYQKLDYKEIKCCDCGKIIKVKGNVKNKISELQLFY